MSSSILPRLQDGRAKSPAPGQLPPLVNDAPASSNNNQRSRLKQPHQRSLPAKVSSSSGVKFPALGKPQQLVALPRCNQEEEERGRVTERDNNHDEDEEDEKRHGLSSSRTSASSRSSLSHSKDKNRDFIKGLEDKKRKEKEDRARQERRKKKLHEKMTRKILEKADARQKQATSSPEVDDLASEIVRQEEPQEDEDEVDPAETERRKEKAKRQKRLLKKQQSHLARIQAKQREEQEQLELEKEREQRKREKVTQTVLHKIQDSMNRSAEEQDAVETEDGEALSPENEEQEQCDRHQANSNNPPPADEQTEEQKQRAKDQRDAFQRKQHKYLQKLSEQRKQKLKEEDDARILQEKRKRRIQKEAQQRLQEAAARQQTLSEARDKEDAAAAAAAAEKAANAGPPVDVEAMIARLSKLKDRDAQIIPEARDFASWKKRHGVAPDQKVFCMTGWYPVIREELEKRGWFYNQERVSPYFDFKWSLKSDELRAFKLEKHQYVNHFAQNAAITTKVGLLHNLRSAVWHQSVDIDAMFPRAYDLNDPMDMDNFIQDFRYGVAEGLLKQLARRGLQLKDKLPGVASMGANEALVDVVLDVARKKVKSKRPESNNLVAELDPLEESVDCPVSTGVNELVTDLQWEVLTNCSLDKPGRLRASFVYKKKVFAEKKEAGDGKSTDTVTSARDRRLQRHAEKMQADAFNREKARLGDLMAHVSLVRETAFDEAIRLAQELEKLCPQFHINGGAEFLLPEPHATAATSTSQNVWIVKPAGMSRGRGIRVFNDLDQLLEYVDVENHKECQWVAQKYIENPLLLCKRKFDIRQWVLVTGWDPLTVWFNDNCYLRFSSEEYSMDDLSDQYVHLTNNSIQKYSDKFNDVYATDDGEMQVEGNMWHSDDFKTFLSTKMRKPEVWDAHMHPRMKEIVVQSLQCVQDQVQHRGNSCELFGYDFMVDENLTPWLIEVNSSPACDYSTPIAQRYVESGLSGIIKVVVDHREYEQKKRAPGLMEKPDTGCWQRIHKAEYVGKPMSSYAVDFQVKGAKVQRGRRSAKSSGGGVKAMTASSSASSVVSTGATTSERAGGASPGADDDTCSGGSDVDALAVTGTLEDEEEDDHGAGMLDDHEAVAGEDEEQVEGDDDERGTSVECSSVEDAADAEQSRGALEDDVDPLL
ncbi:Protein monoglycylase ttll8 [Phytophthora pseudosyringae]|uniref:Protein monoglycylase ttll8 n=1 Tax=Phytophthora pseudosyringae TaxID=221518 RepID=A0A8T1WJS9_9STRA|nr:Protein monoglycylase ttll8 [Phytophthora pseudosyringae]